MPGRTFENSKLPSAVVLRTAETPVSVLVRVTLASGTVAPCASFTVPTTDAVSNCAEARGIPAPSRQMRTSRLTRHARTRIYSLPEGVVGRTKGLYRRLVTQRRPA